MNVGWILLAASVLAVSGLPTLAMGSWHDDGSPVQNSPSISQWEEMKLLYPAIPLTVVAFDDTRSYISVDAPEDFDRALSDFYLSDDFPKLLKAYFGSEGPVLRSEIMMLSTPP